MQTKEEKKIYDHERYLKNREVILAQSRQYGRDHKEEISARDHRNYLKNRDEIREKSHNYHIVNAKQAQIVVKKRKNVIKLQVLTHYGNGKCMCVLCGYDKDLRALSIDHIGGHGTAHRKSLRNSGGAQFYYWLISQGYPEGYRTLCMNCQFITKSPPSLI